MPLLESLIAVVAPHNCLNCGHEGLLLCLECRQLVEPVPPRCYRCRRASADWRTCTTCRKNSPLYSVRVTTEYGGVAEQLVHALKFDGVRAAAKAMADSMATLLPETSQTPLRIVHIPTATSRVRQRGYDQSYLLAKQIAQLSRLPNASLLARSGQTRQVGTKREQRLTQLQHAFRVRQGILVQNAHIVLVDDVLTTGATLEAAARILRTAGARRVEAIVFAQA